MNSDTMKAIALSQFDLLLSLRERIANGENVNPDHLAELGGGLASTVRVLQSERRREIDRIASAPVVRSVESKAA